MSITLDKMRTLVRGKLFSGKTSIPEETLDVYIKDAGARFLQTTKCSRASGTLTLASAGSSVDPTATITEFYGADILNQPSITTTNELIQIVDMDEIRERRFSASGQTGRPELIAFPVAAAAEFYPTADQEYTMQIYYIEDLIDWTDGTTTATTLNIPLRFASIIATGAAAMILEGLPGHKDGRAKMNRFYADMRWARGQIDPPGIINTRPSGSHSSVYARGGAI